MPGNQPVEGAPDKASSTPQTGGGKPDFPSTPAIMEERPTTRKRARMPSSGGGPMTKRIPPRASTYTELPRDRAEKLATLRRGPLDEFTWAAIGGLAASFPSAAHSYSVVMSRKEFSLSLPEAVDFGVLLIFLVLAAVAFTSGRNRGQTSMQYLERHFGKDPDAEPPRRHWWSRN